MWLLNLIEVLFIGAAVAGVALIYFPAALIVAGVTGLLICERAAVARMLREPKGRDQ